MAKGVKKESGKEGSAHGRTLVAPAGVVAAAVVAGLGVLTPIYLATNEDLSGLRFLLAILFAAIAILLMVEAIHRGKSLARRQVAFGALSVAAATTSLLLALLPTSHPAASGGGGLRLKVEPSAPELFRLAFAWRIPLPSAAEDWEELRARGGIDVGDSSFKVVLANESAVPISVLDIHAEILGSALIPRGSLAWEASQGDEGVGQLVALLPAGEKGSVGQVFDGTKSIVEPSEADTASPYFESRYILLEPGEVYPLTLTVKTDVRRTVDYRLVVDAESSDRQYRAYGPSSQIVGRLGDEYQELFDAYYRKGVLPTECTPTPQNPWVNASYTARSEACPDGLGGSFPVRPPSQADFPPGDLSLRVGLRPGRQSVDLSGVTVGEIPAAAPRREVVRPLLDALGSWYSCTRSLPNPRFWTARWIRWNLDLTFASEGEDDCTPSSSSPLRQINLGELETTIKTEAGSIEPGATVYQLPITLQRFFTLGSGSELEQEYVATGVSPCHPSRMSPARTQLDGKSAGGILVLREGDPRYGITGAVSTLPPPLGCGAADAGG